MTRGPRLAASKTDFVERAHEYWGGIAPDWIVALAAAVNAASQPVVARRIGYSAPTVSQVISASYRGDLRRVEEMIRGALMSAVVDCPILGEIGRDRCLQEQDEPFRATSAMRAQLYHACRSGCPHSKHTTATTGDDHA